MKAVAVFAVLHQASLVERRQSFGWADFCDKAAAVVQTVHEEVLKALLVWKELLPKLEPEKEVGSLEGEIWHCSGWCQGKPQGTRL